ncbi:hypothetical protein [Novosphingobium lentum]|uniref:hypothetical protein n=1 Tax=Novosphingobium lentum TaxID=145287 RepID=UPI0008353C8E|nr:hypothetical protein [Novosphingobium lentum]
MLRSITAVPLLLAAPVPTYAQDIPERHLNIPERHLAAREDHSVHITLNPYLWVPVVSGTTALGPLTVPVRVTPGDFAAGFRIGGMGCLAVDDGSRFAFADAVVVDYRNGNFRPFFGQALTSKVRFGQFGVGVHKSVSVGGRAVEISPYVGVQHLRIGSLVTGNLITATGDGDWTSPLAGVSASVPLRHNLRLDTEASAAGFGAFDTDYRNAQIALEWDVARRVAIDAGYRWAKGRYASVTGLALDLHAGGPTVGLRYRFAVGGR